MANQIKNVAIVGTGVLGASWAALYLAHGPGAKRGIKPPQIHRRLERPDRDRALARTHRGTI
jgi:3-hydroxyacyl-CoA dehydrogenase